jgi:mannosyltransferase
MRPTIYPFKKNPPQVQPQPLNPLQTLGDRLQKLQYLPQWLPISLILLLATTLYLYQLGTESLWVDELLSIHRAKNLDYAFRDPRPLSYLFLRVWMFFVGDTDAGLRGLAVLFGLGTVFLTYLLGRRLITANVGLVAALLVTLSPLFINHAQEIRMYTQSTCLGLMGTLLLVEALHRPSTAIVYGWAGFRFLALVTTPLNLFLLLPDCLMIAWRYREKPGIYWAFLQGLFLMGLAWAAFAIPLLMVAIPKFMGGVAISGGVESGTVAIDRPGLFEVVFQLTCFTVWPFGRPNSNAIYGLYQFHAVISLGVLGAAFLNRQRSLEVRWLTAWAILPLIPLFLVSQFSRNLWVDRYLILVAPYVMILLATGFMQIWKKWRIAALMITLISLLATAGGFQRYYTVLDREDWRGLVQLIETQEQPNDVIVWSVNQQIPVALNHYYQGNARIEIKPELASTVLEQDRQQIEAWINSLPPTHSKLWLVHLPTSALFRTVLEENFKIEYYQDMQKFEVFQLSTKVSQ